MFMLKSKHKAILQEAEDRASYWHTVYNEQLSRVIENRNKITQGNTKIVELGNALADEKKTSSKLRGLIATQEQSLTALNSRLENAVEGASPKDKRILLAKQEGKYIYTVTMGDRIRNINVPMTASNFGDYAKRKFLKCFNLHSDNIKYCEVERWEI